MSEGEKNERKAEGKARESECGKAIAEKRVRRSEKGESGRTRVKGKASEEKLTRKLEKQEASEGIASVGIAAKSW